MCYFFFFSSRRRHTRWNCDWSSDVCSSDLSIHFVNTHLRPGSFPMDMVIFTGVESEEEFKHKRSVEYQRLAAQGKLEARLGEKPPSWLVNFGRVVGTVAITIGLVLLVLALTAYFGE